ncbi:hypothetical protein V8D89_012348 [Ganoderma adspersum]
MSTTGPTPTEKWEELLIDKDVIVLKKPTFFRTVNLLFEFAEALGRHTWEFYHYRPWGYIFSTWCSTLDINGYAFSCGAQHPFILKDDATLRYALPDYVLMSLGLEAGGEKEVWPFLIVEIKPLGKLHPDTESGLRAARATFMRTWKQRTNQARLALETHPDQQEAHIMMVAGPWFSYYVYTRSQLMLDAVAPAGSSPPRRKLWRTREAVGPRLTNNRPDPVDHDPAVIDFAETQDVEETVPVENRDQQAYAFRKRKREPEPRGDSHVPASPAVYNVFQLSPTGERNALNPWFLYFLGGLKEKLGPASSRGTFRTQNSWFDWPDKTRPVDDGHAVGFVLPASEIDDGVVVNEVKRVDEDPDMVFIPSTPASEHGPFNAMQLNAMMSPRIDRTSKAFGTHGGTDIPPADSPIPGGSTDSDGAPPRNHLETQLSDSDSEPDDAGTPTARHETSRPSQGSSSQRTVRELSPSESRLERRQHGPLHPPQLYSVLPDSSPLRFTPHKQLFGDRMAVEDDSEFLAGYDSPDPGSEAIARPTSTFPAPPSSPAPSSSSSHLPHDTIHEDAPSGSSQPPFSDRVQQDYTDILPGTPMAPPSHSIPPSSRKVRYVPAPDFRTVPPSRRMTERMGNPATSTGLRLTATPEEWSRNGPTDDELWMIVMEASRQGVKDREQAFRNAGMPENMAYIAYRRHYDVYVRKIQGSSSNYNTTALAAPPLHPQRHRTRDSRDAGPHSSQLPHSSVATVPQSPTPGGDGASRSRPPRASGSGARTAGRTASRNESHSESSGSDFPYGAPGPAASGLPNDAQMNRLAEGIGNLDVAKVPGRAGHPGRGVGRSQEGLHDSDRLPFGRRMQMFRDRGMDDQQAEEAHERYVKLWKRNLDNPAQFHHFLRFDAAASGRTAATSAAPVQGHRSALAGSESDDVHPLPQPSDEETPGETDVGFALPGREQPRTHTSRKGKEKQR